MGGAVAALKLRQRINVQDDTEVSGTALDSHFAGSGDNNGLTIVSSLKARLTPNDTTGGSVPNDSEPIPTVTLGVNAYSAERGDSGLTGIRF